MPRLIFDRTRFEVDAPDGGRLVDVCDEHIRAGVAFACRHANCGVCRLLVTEGAELCEPASDDEQRVLDRVLPGEPDARLGCQLRVRAGDGVVRLRVVR